MGIRDLMERPLVGLRRLGVVVIITTASSACATNPAVPPPVVSKASLGSIIIYRNGVAFFERSLPPGEEELTLRVPRRRVDDFLKSLTIVDRKTGETMPVSYPTMNESGGDVEMTIDLPKGHHGLTISYVTESPAWKPSYRLVLDDEGKGQLQGWAVVDNISGEDWKDVRVGVGSTSALSFRYDLHSVRNIERETLSSGSLLAVAPPTGGSPYANANAEKPKIVANLSQSDVSTLEVDEADPEVAMLDRDSKNRDRPYAANKSFRRPSTSTPRTKGGSGGGDGLSGLRASGRSGGTSSGYGTSSPRHAVKRRPRPRPEPRPAKQPAQTSRSDAMVRSLSQRLQSSGERVRIEGFAQTGEDDPRSSSLARANKLRNRLLAEGVAPSQVEAVGTGEVNDAEGIRVVTVVDSKPRQGEQKVADQVPDSAPLGQAHFLSNEPMTIERDHSAMVSILQEQTKAERVYFYDPISRRGSKSFAFNAVRLENPSEYTLDSGPFTVYAEGQFLGEGLTEPILPHSTAFVPFALDRNVLVEPEVMGREEIDRLVTIQRGIVSTESRKIRTTKLVIVNRGSTTAPVYIRHEVQPGYRLSTLGAKVLQPEMLDGAHLLRVEAPAGESVELTIEEWTPIEKTVDINTAAGIEAIALYLKAAKLPESLRKELAEIVRRHQSRADLEERIRTLNEQMDVYRTRVDELNVQLVTLRKLPQGTKLRRHLSDKMEEISDKLQGATMKMADLRAELMTQRIELQDALAELTLRSNDRGEPAERELAKEVGR